MPLQECAQYAAILSRVGRAQSAQRYYTSWLRGEVQRCWANALMSENAPQLEQEIADETCRMALRRLEACHAALLNLAPPP